MSEIERKILKDLEEGGLDWYIPEWVADDIGEKEEDVKKALESLVESGKVEKKMHEIDKYSGEPYPVYRLPKEGEEEEEFIRAHD